ncbi:unnamed protein product [Orchesella dallaii]|uniref:Uncharacterized protein n=1 Tax=Orchesella dallaii TaxID=48710 RepID=A0ABP1RVM2_9HEXA
MSKCALILAITITAAWIDIVSSQGPAAPVCTVPPVCDATVTNTCTSNQDIFKEYCITIWTFLKGNKGVLECCPADSGVGTECKCCQFKDDDCEDCYFYNEYDPDTRNLKKHRNSTIS